MGRVIQKVITSQAAGTINVAAAPGAGKHVEIHGHFLGLATAGTLKYVSDAAGTPVEACGAVPIAANAPVVPVRFPIPLQCSSNKTADLITTTGVTAGVVWYSIEED